MQVLRTNLADHAVAAAIKSGDVASSIMRLDFCGPRVANAGFKAMVQSGAFDVGELAVATFLQARRYGKDISLLPITVMSRFQHGHIEYNAARGRLSPKEIEGHRVGVRAYTQTTGVWVRGILQDEYGVDPFRVIWVCTDDAHLAEYRDPSCVERVARRSDEIEPMLLAGELDGAIVNGELANNHPDIRPLIPEPRKAGAAWHERTGITPINHMIALRSELVRDRPDIVREIWRMFTESKARMIRPDGPDLLPMGVDACRRSLDALIGYAMQQKIIDDRITVDELFADTAPLLS